MNSERAVLVLQRLVALSPMCCQAMLRLMSIEVSAGRRQEALLQYERYAKRLKLEFDEEPPAELREAYEALKAAPQQATIGSHLPCAGLPSRTKIPGCEHAATRR